jgi:diketogulonate reductase-like aldo/keto reductase
MELNIKTKVKLNNNYEIPIFGLGVYQSEGGTETQNAVTYALEAGYRHIDTARIYRNEDDVGIAIRNSSLKREEIFITSKLWNSDHGFKSTITACDNSLKKLGIDYLDLYLIHWPVPYLRNETWTAMEKLFKDGKCRAIGVSNYTVRHLQELLPLCEIVPAVNQVEFSPFLYQKDLLDYCKAKGIQLEAYSPLTRGEKLHDPTLKQIAAKYSKTTAQLLIRWCLEHNLVAIPKSVTKQRIIENSRVFDFSIAPEDMKILDSLNENLHTSWDPTNAP